MNKSLWIIDKTTRMYEFELSDYVLISDGDCKTLKLKNGEMEQLKDLIKMLKESNIITIESSRGFDVFFTDSLLGVQVRMYE